MLLYAAIFVFMYKMQIEPYLFEDGSVCLPLEKMHSWHDVEMSSVYSTKPSSRVNMGHVHDCASVASDVT